MNLCGINISCRSSDSLFNMPDSPRIVVTVNAEGIVRANKDSKLKMIIDNSLSTIDGQIPLWLFKHKYPRVPIEKISGSDLIYSLPDFAAKNNLRVFLLGGKEESNAQAIVNLRKKFPSLEIEGYSPPFENYPFCSKTNEEILRRIGLFKPDIIFVGFGMGKQEYWAYDNLEFFKTTATKLIIGSGGSFEFASGLIKRAPLFIQKSGLEGVWRLFKEFKWFRFKRLLLSTKIFYYYLKKCK